jgi:hypothetical protein
MFQRTVPRASSIGRRDSQTPRATIVHHNDAE